MAWHGIDLDPSYSYSTFFQHCVVLLAASLLGRPQKIQPLNMWIGVRDRGGRWKDKSREADTADSNNTAFIFLV